jgi:adenosylhomocysteine nucleosidase
MIGIIGAMAEEIELFRQAMDIDRIDRYAQNDYIVGKLRDQNVVLLKSGVGKVNATIGTQVMIDRFDVKLIIFTGLAGGLVPNISRGDIVVSNNVVQHDFDLTAFGRRHGELPDVGRLIEVDPRLVKFACFAYDDVFGERDDKPQLIVGTICSGDVFITDRRKIDWLQREFGAVAIEMEGAAVGYTCFANDVKFVILRTISDTGGDSGVDDFSRYLARASENSFAIVSTMLTIMSYRDSLTDEAT